MEHISVKFVYFAISGMLVSDCLAASSQRGLLFKSEPS